MASSSLVTVGSVLVLLLPLLNVASALDATESLTSFHHPARQHHPHKYVHHRRHGHGRVHHKNREHRVRDWYERESNPENNEKQKLKKLIHLLEDLEVTVSRLIEKREESNNVEEEESSPSLAAIPSTWTYGIDADSEASVDAALAADDSADRRDDHRDDHRRPGAGLGPGPVFGYPGLDRDHHGIFPHPPHHLGCFADALNGNRVLPTQLGSAETPASCVAKAAAAGFRFAAVEFGGQCFVGSTPYGAQGPSLACNMACTADVTQICGGSFAMNVYGVL